MRELTAIALAANLALVNAFQVLPSSCVHRSKLLAWSLASSSQLPTTIRSARGSHDDVEPERVRTPMEPTTVVVERGVALDVGSTFFRAESYLSRDLSVLAAYLYKERTGSLRVLDCFAGVGSRACRYLAQAGADFVHVNDANADVVAVLTGNVERHSRPTTIDGKAEEMEEIEEANNEERLRFRTGESALKASHYVQTEGEISSRSEQKHERYCVTQDDAHAVLLRAALSKEYFDVVDCDSFGLSGRTISAALQAVKLGGLIYMTNTDGKSSAGKDPSHTLAQYGTWALPHQGANEQGLRILVGAVAMAAGPLGLSVEPIFSLYSPHGPVYRSMLRVVPASSALKGGSRGSYGHSTDSSSWSSSGSGSDSGGTSSSSTSSSRGSNNENEDVAAPRKKKRFSLAHNSGFTAHCSRCGQGAVLAWSDLGNAARGCNCAKVEEEDCLDSSLPSDKELLQPTARCTVSGPLWVGPLHDHETLQDMATLAEKWGWNANDDPVAVPSLKGGRPRDHKKGLVASCIASLLEEESDDTLPPFYYNLGAAYKLAGVNPPGRARVYACLKNRGFAVARPAVDPIWGLKTNAPMAEIVSACQEASATHQAEIRAKAGSS